MSLRTRLVLGVVSLAAVGLLILSAVSYTALRSYLSERVDDGLDAAIDPAGIALAERGDCGDGALPGAGAPPGGPEPPGGPDRDPGGGPGRGDGGPQPPAGTYAELRGPGGDVRCSTSFAFGEESVPAPALPGDIELSTPEDPAAFDAPSSEAGAAPYRVAAVPTPDGGTLVVAVSLEDFESTLSRLLVIDAAVSAAVLAAVALIGLWVVRVGLRPLSRMERTAHAVASGELDRRIDATDERTEVGRLAIALNEMLARIEDALERREASEAELRRFLADASHELRTPLSSIRGYAELFRLGALANEEERGLALSRIESEATRMGALVDALLLLSRAEERREPALRPVDLSRLVADAVSDLRASHPDRPVSLNAADGAIVAGDDARLRQVLANLLGNAAAHTRADTPIEVELSASADTVVLSVRDFGDGIPVGSERAVFERFWRADGAAEGSGLGLAIVAAIANAHGGSVEASNADGGGARFELRLPRGVDGSPTA